jgi:hypothetical protein
MDPHMFDDLPKYLAIVLFIVVTVSVVAGFVIGRLV